MKIFIPAKHKSAAAAAKLSPRETQVISLHARGETFKSIAATLQISHRTVEAHAQRLRRKLKAQSSLHAVVLLLG